MLKSPVEGAHAQSIGLIYLAQSCCRQPRKQAMGPSLLTIVVAGHVAHALGAAAVHVRGRGVRELQAGGGACRARSYASVR